METNNSSYDNAVYVSNLCKKDQNAVPVLQNFGMSVKKGSIYGLLGSSGCGKTTVISCIVGLTKWDSGRLLVFGQKPGPEQNVGYMPQDLSLYNYLWNKISENQKQIFCRLVQSKIDNNCEFCVEQHCNNSVHKKLLDTKVNELMEMLKVSSEVLLRKRPKAGYQVYGWNEDVKQVYNDYRSAFIEWKDTGFNDYFLFEKVNFTRRSIKYALRRCRKQKSQRMKEDLVLSYNGKNFVKFWEHVKRTEGSVKSDEPCEMDGVKGDSEVRHHWASIYRNLFNANHSDEGRIYVEKYASNKQSATAFSEECISKSISDLKSGKACGSEGLQAEHYKFAAPALVPYMTVLINSLFAHSYIPESVMTVVIVPILKKKGLNAMKSENYRPIAIASVFSKLVELIILKNYGYKLNTTSNQFGFKKGVGTEMAIYTVKQIAHYYLRKSTPVFACFLDASKAFDNVNHFKLLKKLCDRGLPPLVIGLLAYWFRTQTFVVRWRGGLSPAFPVRNSVRQGGLISPICYAVYTDQLSLDLTRSGVRCRVGDVIANHCAYADDVCLLTTSIEALKKLLIICEKFAVSHDLSFNPSKTVCMSFCEYSYDLTRPLIKFCGKSVSWVDSVKYLGYEISCRERDTEELLRRRREIYARANLLNSRFGGCDVNVKRYLFKTYFSTIYCCSLWVPVKKEYMEKLRVAYNDAFRLLFRYSRRSSASNMFCENLCSDFYAVRRQAAFSLLDRLADSCNSIVVAIINSEVFTTSSISLEWKRILFNM